MNIYLRSFSFLRPYARQLITASVSAAFFALFSGLLVWMVGPLLTTHFGTGELTIFGAGSPVQVAPQIPGADSAALPSVVGGLVSVPVIAVPTSIGYGASFGGVAALLGMLNSCASNVTVVNIDNGFGAGYVASLINRN